DMSMKLAALPCTVAVIGIRGEKAKLLVACSKDVDLDCRKALKGIMAIMGGGGGGKPDFAQGGGGDPLRLKDALDQALDILSKEMVH
ncbi:MAG: DHHA1 domain-containing protein, partial [Methanomassiliicoccales archaeon]|nr:DHHA1 domain-containing protein [Methanomassiliicoccales archaeon]